MPEGAFLISIMKSHPTLLRTLHYAVGFTAFLMIPIGFLLLWLARQSGRLSTDDFDGQSVPGAYMETGAYLVMALGLILIAGVLAFAKNRSYGRGLLMAGSVATIALSALPVFQLAVRLSDGWLVTGVLVAWIIFILPYGALVYLLARNRSDSHTP